MLRRFAVPAPVPHKLVRVQWERQRRHVFCQGAGTILTLAVTQATSAGVSCGGGDGISRTLGFAEGD